MSPANSDDEGFRSCTSELASSTSSSDGSSSIPPELLLERLRLFDREDDLDDHNEIKAAPIFTELMRRHAARLGASSSGPIFSQYGVIASKADIASPESDGILYCNVAAPSSTFICGSQGSGKSHTLSCLLENCLIPSIANELPRPLTGIVFHYDTFISDTAGSPCEAAFLSSHHSVLVRVLCAPTNVTNIRNVYSRFPNVKIEELRINETDLNTKRMMDLMAVREGGSMPLYLHVVARVLRDLRIQQQMTGSAFKYAAFRQMIELEQLTGAQRGPLIQRLDTLQSFMVKEQAEAVLPSTAGKKKKKHYNPQVSGNDWTPKPAQLTIVDLSCPCVTAETACSLFNICLSLFLEQSSSVGRIIALDEAHKYMNESAEAGTLTEQLLATIRLQRHLGTRVVISTQEPTVSPKLLDLCSVTVVHRFTSPAWLEALKKHLAGASAAARLMEKLEEGGGDGAARPADALYVEGGGQNAAMAVFAQIVRLRVGEALLFAPSAVLGLDEASRARKLNQGFLKIRVRKRVTDDGGRSIMAG